MGSVFVLERNSPLGCNWRWRERVSQREREREGRKERKWERREEETGEIAWLGLCGMIVFLTGK